MASILRPRSSAHGWTGQIDGVRSWSRACRDYTGWPRPARESLTARLPMPRRLQYYSTGVRAFETARRRWLARDHTRSTCTILHRMSATIVAIATHKGGVGKTVITMALSAAFARAGQPALVVDMDPQGHASIGLGVEVLDDELTLRDFFLDGSTPIDKLIRETHVKGLHVLPSNIRLAPVVQSLYMRPRREEMLRRGLASVRQHYSYVFIDCPPALGVLTETSLSAADLVIVPCQMEARAVDGLVDLLEMVSLIRGPSFDAWRILLNRVDTRKTVTNDAVMAELEP
ncbi:MAG: hypothetical protein CL471_03575 [Acidobacteria bacterium]|nr:hypothetical protein [Acidobacteriota bacterium]